MASFGKISNSLIQGTNENTFAFANINFDFSLVSLAAPTDFAAVGTALAHSRRENAEHGALHRTARKLGALFEGVVPQVPQLVSAYGKRASEIMKHPGLNPLGIPTNTARSQHSLAPMRRLSGRPQRLAAHRLPSTCSGASLLDPSATPRSRYPPW